MNGIIESNDGVKNHTSSQSQAETKFIKCSDAYIKIIEASGYKDFECGHKNNQKYDVYILGKMYSSNPNSPFCGPYVVDYIKNNFLICAKCNGLIAPGENIMLYPLTMNADRSKSSVFKSQWIGCSDWDCGESIFLFGLWDGDNITPLFGNNNFIEEVLEKGVVIYSAK